MECRQMKKAEFHIQNNYTNQPLVYGSAQRDKLQHGARSKGTNNGIALGHKYL